MLRVLSGTQRGWFGSLPLSREFLDAMDQHRRGST
jgi:hypothetical protein